MRRLEFVRMGWDRKSHFTDAYGDEIHFQITKDVTDELGGEKPFLVVSLNAEVVCLNVCQATDLAMAILDGVRRQ